MAKITMDEKARTLLAHIYQSQMPQDSIDAIKLVLKEQDRDTRHACAEEIAGVLGVTVNCRIDGNEHIPVGVSLISKDYAHNVVMNCRGGIE